MLPSQHTDAPPFDAVVLVGSQGGLAAAGRILARLPAAFPASVVIALHRATDDRIVASLLDRDGSLPVHVAAEGMDMEAGNAYVMPADCRLLLGYEGVLELTSGLGFEPTHHFADVLLMRAAVAMGPRLIAAVLTGRLDGGAEGMRAVKHAGGRVLVEDPSTAEAPGMPNATLATGCADFVLPLEGIADALVALCAVPGAADLLRVRLNAGVRERSRL